MHFLSTTNLSKSMWKLVFNVTNVILNLEIWEGKPTMSIGIMTDVKLLKTYVFGTKKLKKKKLQFLWTYEIWSNFNHSKAPNLQWYAHSHCNHFTFMKGKNWMNFLMNPLLAHVQSAKREKEALKAKKVITDGDS